MTDHFTLWEIWSPPGLLQGSHVWLLRGTCSPKFRNAMGVFSFSLDSRQFARWTLESSGSFHQLLLALQGIQLVVQDDPISSQSCLTGPKTLMMPKIRGIENCEGMHVASRSLDHTGSKRSLEASGSFGACSASVICFRRCSVSPSSFWRFKNHLHQTKNSKE